MPKENDKKLLEQLKLGFRTLKWNKYRSEMTTQSNNNLHYLIDPTFTKVNRLFCHLKELKKTIFTLLCTKRQNKRFWVLTDGKSFFDLSVKNESLRKNY